MNLKSEEKASKLFCSNDCKIAITLKVITEDNNVETTSREHFTMQGKNKNTFVFFFLWESYTSIAIHHEICQLLYVRIQFDEKDPRINYRLTPISQDTYINR